MDFFHCRCSGNSKILTVVILLFGSITVAQFLASLAAGSDALFVDCGSMLVDTCTYALNLCAEKRRGQVMDLSASGISILVLLIVSISGLKDSMKDLRHPREKEHLSPEIVLIFGSIGVCFDLISFWGFYRWGLHSILSGYGEGSPMASPMAVNDAMSPSSRIIGSTSMNMRSAFMHVGADLLRSMVTVLEGLLVIFGHTDGKSTDSLASLVVSITILSGVAAGVLAWSRQACLFFSRRSSEELLPDTPLVEFSRSLPDGLPECL